jgi:hypothetical protein
MTFVNFVYPILLPIVFLSALFLPALAVIGFIPKRLAAARHAALAATFVAVLAGFALAPAIGGLKSGPVHHAPVAMIAKPTSARIAATPALPAKTAPPNYSYAPVLHPRWDVGNLVFQIARTAGFVWLGAAYLLSLVVLLSSNRFSGRPDVRVSRLTRVPVSLWAFKHYIVLPEEASTWNAQRLDRVISHEQAHIERWDWIWQACGNVATAYCALSPLSWICLRKMRYEAERVADENVLLKKASPTDYATDLLEIAKSASRPANCAALGIVSKGTLKSRVAAILANTKPAKTSRAELVGAASVSVLALAGGVFLVVPGVAHTLHLAASSSPSLTQLMGKAEYYKGMKHAFPSDIRLGLTTPGRASNSWTAKFATGVEGKLVGIYWGTPDGAQFRLPDGKSSVGPVPAPDYVKGRPGHLDILFSLPASQVPLVDKPTLCSGSYDDHGKSPRTETFAGGYAALSPDGKDTYVHGFFEITNPHTSVFDGKEPSTTGDGPLATEFTVGLSYLEPDPKVTAVPLDDLLHGTRFALDDGYVSLGHWTKVESGWEGSPMKADSFAVRVERLWTSHTQYLVSLSDTETMVGNDYGFGGCGGQPDGISPKSYFCDQWWFDAKLKSKRFAIVQGAEEHCVDFLAIPIVDCAVHERRDGIGPDVSGLKGSVG